MSAFVRCLWSSDARPETRANFPHVCLVTDEQAAEANDSDSSPPRSRGRGRFEKGRIKGVSRGQADDARSTSSQGMDDTESSSHVRHTHSRILLLPCSA